jgi:hypothetical protein
MRQVGSYPGYAGGDANILEEAALVKGTIAEPSSARTGYTCLWSR